MESERSSQTVTFLFTDIEKSTRLWEQYPQAMKAALERHDQILQSAVESSNGWVVKTTGDGLMAAFASALDGVNACLKAQQDLLDELWGEVGSLRVRMGLHAGEAHPRGDDYYGPAVNRAAWLMAAAHGGQVLLLESAASLVRDLLPEGVGLRDLGDHRLKDLERPERIFQLLHPGLAADFPPLATLSSRPNNLPTQPTEIIGREVELGEIKALLDTAGVRLLTLTGPGGTGKTRLALQVAADLIDRFQDGVFFVDLAPACDLETVLASIARVIGIKESGERPLLDELNLQLKAQSMLLLLDNFEQVTSTAPKISELIRSCPDVKALVTSREALHVRGEQVYPVPPLSLPESGLKQQSMRQMEQARRCAQAVIRIAEEHEFQIWRAVGLSLSGAALAGMGQGEEGRAQLIQGMEIYKQLKSPPVFWPMLLVMRARVEGQLGNPHDAISLLDQATEIIGPHSEIILADVYRIKGEILLGYSSEISPGDVTETKAHTGALAQAEALLLQSLQIGQKMQSSMFELLAAVSLCRLWRAQGKIEPARQLLSSVLAKFSESFGTADLRDATALLKDLS